MSLSLSLDCNQFDLINEMFLFFVQGMAICWHMKKKNRTSVAYPIAIERIAMLDRWSDTLKMLIKTFSLPSMKVYTKNTEPSCRRLPLSRRKISPLISPLIRPRVILRAPHRWTTSKSLICPNKYDRPTEANCNRHLRECSPLSRQSAELLHLGSTKRNRSNVKSARRVSRMAPLWMVICVCTVDSMMSVLLVSLVGSDYHAIVFVFRNNNCRQERTPHRRRNVWHRVTVDRQDRPSENDRILLPRPVRSINGRYFNVRCRSKAKKKISWCWHHPPCTPWSIIPILSRSISHYLRVRMFCSIDSLIAVRRAHVRSRHQWFRLKPTNWFIRRSRIRSAYSRQAPTRCPNKAESRWPRISTIEITIIGIHSAPILMKIRWLIHRLIWTISWIFRMDCCASIIWPIRRCFLISPPFIIMTKRWGKPCPLMKRWNTTMQTDRWIDSPWRAAFDQETWPTFLAFLDQRLFSIETSSTLSIFSLKFVSTSTPSSGEFLSILRSIATVSDVDAEHVPANVSAYERNVSERFLSRASGTPSCASSFAGRA